MADIYEIKPGARQVGGRLQSEGDATEEANETLLETLSHDLRTPLNTIIGFADMMDQEILGPLSNPHYREYVEVISTEGRRMLDFINDLLNRKRFENMKRTEQGFRHVIELAPDLIAVCRGGAIDLINPAGADMLGVWPAVELKGRIFTDFVQADSLAHFQGGIENLTKERLRTPMVLLRADGTTLDVELAALPYEEHEDDGDGTAYIIMARDVTERNRALKAQATREEHLRKIMDTVADGIITIDETGTIETLNPTAEEIFGYKPGELVGSNVKVLMNEDDAGNHDHYLARYTNTGVRHIIGSAREVIGRRKNGSLIPIELAVSEMRFSGRRLFIGALRDITERKENEERLRDLATRDPLTRLPNRNLFTERLEESIEQADTCGVGFAVLFLDLDNFKTINDALGHLIGDRIIQLAGQRVCGCVRGQDTVAHLSGDEFMVILEGMDDEARAAKIARDVLKSLSQPFKVDGREVFTSCSIGVVMYPKNANSLVELMRNVDTAAHFAKKQGRANFQFYTEQLSEDARRRIEVESGLRRALENDEFELVFQPKVDLETRRIIGAEALLRWDNANLGKVSPVEFIPVAEETGLIVAIGSWVLRQACETAAVWIKEGLTACHIAVNLSAMQFLHGDLAGEIKDVLDTCGLDPHLLDVELTESMLVSNAEETIRILKVIKDMGVNVSMDDFGTGYSSLSYLTRFPLDNLKVDRSFVTGLPDDRDASAVARAIISMAQNLNLNIIAEGIETENQVGFLHALGCQVGQGYLFSPPVSNEKFMELARAGSSAFLKTPPAAGE
ncbi:EAL domain-containing protein [Thalassospiraceae bacterium LMO-SO8]|nr:EAL domain-containing protein [Alphaproteobacteria bacterium LMO-S08]WND77978.1 EAL domain-containing protein [Thalassospiraceae bacterium LMO-SO8]